jgi:hypothetical protein
MNTCETCRFWNQWPHLHHLGSCRRYPPQFTGECNGLLPNHEPKDIWGNWSFPLLREDSLCGEHQPKVQP